MILFATAITAAAIYQRIERRTLLEEAQRERRKLQSQLDERDLTISQLKAEVRNLRAIVGSSVQSQSRSRRTASGERESDRRRQSDASQASRSSAAALAESLTAESLRASAEQSRL